MELTYHWEGDVLIPDLELEDGRQLSDWQMWQNATEVFV